MIFDNNFFYNDLRSLRNIEAIKVGEVIDIEDSGQVLQAPYNGNTYRAALYRGWNNQGHGKVILLKQLMERLERYAKVGKLEWHSQETRTGLENLLIHYSQKYTTEENYITDMFNQIFTICEKIDTVYEDNGIKSSLPVVEENAQELREEEWEKDFAFISSFDPEYAQPLNIGSQWLQCIPVSELQPGDILTAYQELTTQPIPLAIITTQRLEGLVMGGQEKNTSNLLHLEIVLGQTNGKVTVAHSRPGGPPQFAIDTKRFDNLSTPVVVIRARTQEIREEVVKIAYSTVHKGNRWRIKGFSTGDKEELKQVAKDRLLRKWHGTDQKIMQIARLAVDSFDRFNRRDINQPKSMSCAQYVSNVLNSALIRVQPEMKQILNDSTKTREQKTQEIFEILMAHKEILKPAGLFHSDASPATLVSHLFANPNDWLAVGYMGYLPIKEQLSVKDTENSNYPLSLQDLESLQLGSYSLVYEVFKSLHLWHNNNYLLGSAQEKNFKFLIAFTYLYALKHNLDSRLVAGLLCDKISINQLEAENKKEVIEKIEAYKEVKSEAQKFIDQLNRFQNTEKPIEQVKEIKSQAPAVSSRKLLGIVKIFKKDGNLDEENKQKVLSMAYIENLAEQADYYSQYANYGIATASILGGALVNPATAAIAAFSYAAKYVAHSKVKETLKNWEDNIETVYRERTPTHEFRLHTRVEFGERPWLLFSKDKEKTWQILPFEKRQDEEWSIGLNLQDDLNYKIFRGPWDTHSTYPMAGAKWQRTPDNQNVTLTIKQIDSKNRNENQLIMLPTCLYPEWE